MDLHPLNKVVTDLFSVQGDERIDFDAGFGKLSATLVRAAAQKIYVPGVAVAEASYLTAAESLKLGKKLGKPKGYYALRHVGASEVRERYDRTTKKYPSTLANRIKLVDPKGHTYEKALAYLEPVIQDSPRH